MEPSRGIGRRRVLRGTLGLGLALAVAGGARADDPRRARPQPGDVVVFASGSSKGRPVARDALPLGGPQVMAYPQDPASGAVRNGSRLNQILLVRLEPGELSEATRAHAAGGVVAYSAVCTHQGCPVSAWDNDAQVLFCNCHKSQFDPKASARVLGGPAPRPLAVLPLEVENDALIVAGEFIGSVGFKRG